MSGNTFCNICGKYKLSADLPVSIELWKTCNCEPTPPEGEAVPEQRDKCIRCGAEECGHGKCPNCDFKCRKCLKLAADAAPVVSTAAPEPDNSRCAVCGWPLAETVDKGCTRGNCSMRPMPKVAYDPKRANREYGKELFAPVAPESYKPAEGPKWNEMLLKFREYRLWMHEQVNWLANKWQQRGDVECREEMLDLLRIEPDAATPVTVEAPERPEWFNYIRVRQRTNLSTKQTDFVASFGPRNILTPEADAETMERKLEMVKEWLWLFMNKKQ